VNAVEATAGYEPWLRTQLGAVLEDDLALKHERSDERHLLRAMGFETANVHRRSSAEAVARVRAHAAGLAAARLQAAVEQLTAVVERDWRDWRAHQSG
jgi:hypothetical protein